MFAGENNAVCFVKIIVKKKEKGAVLPNGTFQDMHSFKRYS
jgi:hypothetical protein